jgi:hypothetical protein
MTQEIYGVAPGGFPATCSKVEKIEVESNTLRDEEITYKPFQDLNQNFVGILGDRALVILSDYEEEEEGANAMFAKASPQPPKTSPSESASRPPCGCHAWF